MKSIYALFAEVRPTARRTLAEAIGPLLIAAADARILPG